MDVLKCDFTVNGLSVEARYDGGFVEGELMPLLRKLSAMQLALGRRLIVFLAAPPAAGKSTLALFIEKLSAATEGLVPVQAAGLDGFHYRQAYLDSHYVNRGGETIPLARVKGGPESFDVRKLNYKLRESVSSDCALWPFYDRKLHDVIEDAFLLDKPIALVEGNWLLMKDDIWLETSLMCDYSISIKAPESMLRDSLIKRKLAGGYELEQALSQYEFSDGPNIRRFLLDSAPGDARFIMTGYGNYVKEDYDVQPI